MRRLRAVWDFWYFAVLMFYICALLSGCHRKPRLDPMADIPDLPGDTVYVTKVIDRCNYQYLSSDPKKAKKQLQSAEKALDVLIAQYDPILKEKGRIASKLIRENKKL